jgi:hypothetical protein
LHGRQSCFTLGLVKPVGVMAAVLLVMTSGAGFAQTVAPVPVTGPAASVMPQLHPPTPLEQVREQATRRASPLPPAPPIEERWVPERQVQVPPLGRTVVIPGHYERRLTDQQYTVPTLPAYDTTSGIAIIILPGGERLPVDLRPGP